VLVGIVVSLLGGIFVDVFDVGWIIQFFVVVVFVVIGIMVFV